MIALISLWLLSAPASAAPAPDAAAIRKDIQAERDAAERRLKSDPESKLAAIKRVDFGGKTTLSIGAAADNDVALDGLSAHHLKVTATSESFRVDAVDPDASFTVSGSTASRRATATAPESLGVGRYHLRLSHQGYPAVIVFDPRSPRLKEYHGLPYFPIDLSYRFVARLVPNPKAEKVEIQSTHSAARRAERMGWFDLKIGGASVRLAAMRLIEPGARPDELEIFFRDKTTGHETYSVGRYVDVEKQPDGSYVVDFNRAYNPACAVSKYYNCPIPPKENYLTVAIRAGAQDPHYH